MMPIYSVYILKCNDDSYYTGFTKNLKKRINEHQSGLYPKSYTNSRRPIDLVFSMEFDSIKKAFLFERKIKSWSRKKKEALINKDWNDLKKLSVCKNQSSHKNFKKGVSLSSFDSAQDEKHKNAQDEKHKNAQDEKHKNTQDEQHKNAQDKQH